MEVLFVRVDLNMAHFLRSLDAALAVAWWQTLVLGVVEVVLGSV